MKVYKDNGMSLWLNACTSSGYQALFLLPLGTRLQSMCVLTFFFPGAVVCSRAQLMWNQWGWACPCNFDLHHAPPTLTPPNPNVSVNSLPAWDNLLSVDKDVYNVTVREESCRIIAVTSMEVCYVHCMHISSIISLTPACQCWTLFSIQH